MNEHQKFEILCALVVVGQASDSDLRELNCHLQACIDCQNRLSDFAQVSAQALPLSEQRHGKVRPTKAMTTRFVERARAEGIPLAAAKPSFLSHWSFQSLAWKGSLAAAVLLLAIIAGGISRSVHSRARWTNSSTVTHSERTAEPSTPPQIVADRSDPKRPYLPAQRRTRVSKAHFEISKGESRSRDPRQFTTEAAFSNRVYSNLADDSTARRLLFNGASLALLADRSPVRNTWAYTGALPNEERAPFVIASLSFPLRGFSFDSDRNLRDHASHSQSASIPNIDWYHIRFVRTESLRTSSHIFPTVLAPAWPFSQDPAGDRR